VVAPPKAWVLAAWLLGSRVRIPLGAWRFVSCVYMWFCPASAEAFATC
jgi:hypothetical protein